MECVIGVPFVETLFAQMNYNNAYMLIMSKYLITFTLKL